MLKTNCRQPGKGELFTKKAYNTLTVCFKMCINSLKPSGYYIYHLL
jgi:hypothetical protein